jgi:hypothetical protein
LLLLAGGLAAVAFASHAAADPTATTPSPAPDPNPPAGAAPDPYSAPPKSTPTPSRTPAPVHVTSRVYTPPAASTPSSVVQPPAPQPATRPAAHRSHRTHPARRRRHVVRRPAKHVVLHLTPRLDAYAAVIARTLDAAVAPAAGDGVARRRRAAGIALAALAALSLGLLLGVNRLYRVRL